MKYGFVIDNRKCIGCHACTVACKSEHDVAVGVNRTWVKQVEKGSYPNTRRVFSVMRCNHCTDAPCVEICPTQALFIREDGIVDFDNDRCIGCKSCMQACPYDALYIDPDTHTAAKCNYCAHRIDVGLEPACVNVCPEHAIISGDMDDKESEISELLSRQQVTVRKPEKGTAPNVYYINGDQDSLNPDQTETSDSYMWNSQARGVGHFSRYTEKLTGGVDLKSMVDQLGGNQNKPSREPEEKNTAPKTIDVLLQQKGGNKRVYDAPDKGILWGWEVAAYVMTKAIAAGIFILLFLANVMGIEIAKETKLLTGVVSLLFLALTGLLLIKDLDQPKRFLYVLLRPQWKSWLVKGAYFITGFGAFSTLFLVATFLDWSIIASAALWVNALFAVMTAVYTAFLFAQAKGRDFWQSPTLAIHMFIHSLMAGAAIFVISSFIMDVELDWLSILKRVLLISVIVNLLTMLIEFSMTHPTVASKRTIESIIKGKYRLPFLLYVIVLGNIVPLLFLSINSITALLIVPFFILLGLWFTEKIWVEAPQNIPLS